MIRLILVSVEDRSFSRVIAGVDEKPFIINDTVETNVGKFRDIGIAFSLGMREGLAQIFPRF